MDALNQLMQLPYAFTLLPIFVFLAIAGGFFWALRTDHRAEADRDAEEAAHADVSVLVKEKPKELRSATRRQGNPIVVHVAAPEDKKTPSTGSVLDRSLGGLRLALYQEVQVGSVLSVRPIEAEKMVPWVDIQIRSCKPSKEMPGQFEIGCEYVKSPPYSIQLLFG